MYKRYHESMRGLHPLAIRRTWSAVMHPRCGESLWDLWPLGIHRRCSPTMYKK